MEASELQKINAQNMELEAKLTKKNAEYIFQLKKQLEAHGISEIERVQRMNGLLVELVEKQKSGVTARQLFGTVTEQVKLLVGTDKPLKDESDENTHLFLMWSDNSLLLLGLLGLMAGVLGIFAENGRSTYGIITTLVMALIGGLVFYLMYHFMYQYDRPEADKSKRPSRIKSMAIITGVALVWMLMFGLTLFISPNINVYPAAWVMIVIGAFALALRTYLKRRFKIRGSMMNRAAIDAEASRRAREDKKKKK